MALFIKRLKTILKNDDRELTASEMEVIRKLLADNSVTLASVRRGNFGEFAKRVAEEEFPFEDNSPGRTFQ